MEVVEVVDDDEFEAIGRLLYSAERWAEAAAGRSFSGGAEGAGGCKRRAAVSPVTLKQQHEEGQALQGPGWQQQAGPQQQPPHHQQKQRHQQQQHCVPPSASGYPGTEGPSTAWRASLLETGSTAYISNDSRSTSSRGGCEGQVTVQQGSSALAGAARIIFSSSSVPDSLTSSTVRFNSGGWSRRPQGGSSTNSSAPAAGGLKRSSSWSEGQWPQQQQHQQWQERNQHAQGQAQWQMPQQLQGQPQQQHQLQPQQHQLQPQQQQSLLQQPRSPWHQQQQQQPAGYQQELQQRAVLQPLQHPQQLLQLRLPQQPPLKQQQQPPQQQQQQQRQHGNSYNHSANAASCALGPPAAAAGQPGQSATAAMADRTAAGVRAGSPAPPAAPPAAAAAAGNRRKLPSSMAPRSSNNSSVHGACSSGGGSGGSSGGGSSGGYRHQQWQQQWAGASRGLKQLPWVGSVRYACTAAEVDAACRQLMAAGPPSVIGFDLEWKPSFVKNQPPNKAALVQLAYCCKGSKDCQTKVEDKGRGVVVLLLHILHSGITRKLQEVLLDDQIQKLGVNIGGDVLKLSTDYGVQVFGVMDLSDAAHGRQLRAVEGVTANIQPKRWSLAGLIEEVFNLELPKPQHIRLGDWERRSLTPEQQRYAAMDAYACLLLHWELQGLPSKQTLSKQLIEAMRQRAAEAGD